MQITNEVKTKIFPLYLGQQMLYNKHLKYEVTLENLCYQKGAILIHSVLILKPIHQINKEDAIELAKILLPNKISDYLWNEITGQELSKFILNGRCYSFYFKEAKNWIFGEQFLRLRGYDLPHYLLNNKTLYDSGLAIYET